MSSASASPARSWSWRTVRWGEPLPPFSRRLVNFGLAEGGDRRWWADGSCCGGGRCRWWARSLPPAIRLRRLVSTFRWRLLLSALSDGPVPTSFSFRLWSFSFAKFPTGPRSSSSSSSSGSMIIERSSLTRKLSLSIHLPVRVRPELPLLRAVLGEADEDVWRGLSVVVLTDNADSVVLTSRLTGFKG